MKPFVVALFALLCSHAALAAVNLNTASKDELVGLPGIGPAKAQAILDYRQQHGPFRAVEEVRKVRGIGEKLYLQIKPELTVTGGAARAAAGPARADPKADAKPEPKPEAKAAPRTAQGAVPRDDRPKK